MSQDFLKQDLLQQDIPQLTGLRAVAALMVLSLHLDQTHGNWLSPLLPVVAQGHLGVDIFFVLSGYILTHVYAGTARSRRGYGVFLWRRLARIYPMHLATLLALVAMVKARGLLDTNIWDVSDLPRHLLLLQAWTAELTWNLPSWSISAEWAAYVAFPLAIVAIARAPWPVAAAVVVALLAGFQMFGIEQRGIAGSWMGWPAAFRIASEFALGVFAHRLMLKATPSRLYDGLAVAAFAIAIMVPIELIRVAAIGVFVATTARATGPVHAALASRPLVWLGTISYSIYMVHYPAIKVIQNINDRLGIVDASIGTRALATLVWIAVVIALADLCVRLFETPVRQWCRSLEPRLFGQGAGAATAA